MHFAITPRFGSELPLGVTPAGWPPCAGIDLRPIDPRYQHGFSTRSGNDGI